MTKKLTKFDIIFAGVGGQGVLTIAGIVARAALFQGYDVKAAELHGLAMRFGSVETHLRFGTKLYSPLVKRGNADLIISLEPAEAVRVSRYAGPRTNYIFDKKALVPNYMHLDKKEYPTMEAMVKDLERLSPEGQIFDLAASQISKEHYGSVVASNIVLLGRALGLGFLPLEKESILHAMSQVLPEHALEDNKILLNIGYRRDLYTGDIHNFSRHQTE